MNIAELLSYAVKNGCSDLHLSAGMPPIFRLDGDLQQMQADVLSHQTLVQLLNVILSEVQRAELESNLELDFSYDLTGVSRFRVNIYNQQRGRAAAFRVIPEQIPTLDALNMGHLKEFCKWPNGLILMTGPTGCGKSTTLATLIDEINSTQSKHILTIEDPIEFVHSSKHSLINQREVGRHTLSFANALRAGLREDPDVILIGEMRDIETIRLALTAAETGHLVLATLHTASAVKTINRIIDAFPTEEQSMIRTMLSESLRAVVTQVLLKKANGSGRVAAQEIMLCNNAIRNLIREDKIPQMYSIIQTNREAGMQTLDAHLRQLVLETVVNEEEANIHTVHKDVLQ